MSRSRRRRSAGQRPRHPLEYAASLHPGIEGIAIAEIESRLSNAQVIDSQRGWAVFDYPGMASQVLELRTTEDVFALLYRTHELPQHRGQAIPLLTRMAYSSRHWSQAMTQFYETRHPVKRVTYRVIAQMTGRHGFRRQEMRDAVLTGVQMRWPNWKPVADDAHLEIWVTAIDSYAAIAVRLSDRKMRHRTYKAEHVPASLRPSLAAAMVALSKPKPQDRFCDPMCGAGTILAERILYGPVQQLFGGDVDAQALVAAQVNLSLLDRSLATQILHLWDARHLPIGPGSLDVVVSNLPFGIQIGSHDDNTELYERLLMELGRTLRIGAGRAVLLTSEKELMRTLIGRQDRLILEDQVLIGVLGQAARIYALRKVR
jgi:23S rRNA G2445 N2-methylase RlmL